MSHSTEASLLKDMQKVMGRKIPPEIWSVLRAKGSVAAVLDGVYEKGDLVDDVENLEPYVAYLVKPSGRSNTGADGELGREAMVREASAYPELDALCEIMAMEASANPEVIGFRNDFLEGDLVPPSAVAGWIRAESEKCKRLPLSSQTNEDQAAMLGQAQRWRGSALVPRVLPDWPNRPESVPGDTLAFPVFVPSRFLVETRVRSVPVPVRGPLWLLKFVAVGLMEEYPWSEAQALGLILSGDTPRLPTASVTLYPLFPFRIVLDLDPGLDAKRLCSEYREAQRALLSVKKRAKVQSEKHLRLAVFLARGKNGTWNDMMEAWNKHSRPEWAYTDSRRFERDASQSLAALRQRRDRSRMPSPFRRIEHTYGLR